MELHIRRADADDAELISVLGAVTFYEAYFETDDPRDIARYITETYAPERIARELLEEGSTFFIALLEGRAVGFARLRENSVPDCLAGENTAEIQRIYLVERVWRRGIGRKLVERCLEEARRKGFDSVWLGTWEENRRARKFYESLGFRRAGEYRFYYGELLTTNHVMKKDLQ